MCVWGGSTGAGRGKAPGKSLGRAKGPRLISAANSGGLEVALRETSEWTDI